MNGAVVCRAKLKLATQPGRPDPPVAESVSDRQAYITWSPPRNEGNLPTLAYALEYSMKEDKDFTVVSESIGQEYYVISNLQPDSAYCCRIRARNRLGWSEWSFPSRFIKTKASGSADAVLEVPKVIAPLCVRQLLTVVVFRAASRL